MERRREERNKRKGMTGRGRGWEWRKGRDSFC